MPSTPIVSSIRIEGGLFPSGFLARLATFDDGLDQLTPAAYGCLPGETLRDAITDAWNRLQRVWASFQAYRATKPDDADGTGATRQRWLLPLLQVLGYQDLERAPSPEIEGKAYTLSHLYRNVPIHLIGYRLDLDRRTARVAGAAISNAHGLVQEFLNRSPAHQWGIVSNGLTLRLLRDNASLTRQAYLEVDLEALFDQHAYHDFAQVWLLLHASRFQSAAGATSTTPGDAIIDRWYATGTKEGVRALDRLRDNVQSAIEHLGRGFLTSSGPGNRALREALAGDRLSAQDYYRELLRTVYRLLFCFVAEDRDVLLLPTATAVQRDRYARWYATSRLRRLAASRAGTPHGDGWKSLQLIFSWLSSDIGCPALGVPALGSLLWSAEATPHLDACNLSNQALFATLRALAVTTDGGVRRPIDFKNLGAEELGGIYESLLELHPELSAESGAFSLKSVAGSERKTTGSYYTPTSLIKCLLDSALDPVVEAAANKPTPAEAEQAILDLTVVDPACGSGHFLVAAAHRIAKRLASVRTGDLEPAPDAVRHALRDVISRCIYGVDLNPMSVELCKVSLWLEAIDPGRPLSFLDHRIRCGNSLIGTTPELVAKGVPDEAFDPITGDDKETCKQRKKRNKPERAAMETRQTSLFAVLASTAGTPLDDLRRGDDATLAGVSRLRDAWQTVENDPAQQRAKWAADAWAAAFLAQKTSGSPTITSEAVRVALQTGPSGLDPQQRVVIQMMADEYRVFHWHIAFPELFGEGRPNGFSAVLGNPPWERVKLSELEFFASRIPSILEHETASQRKVAIASLANTDSGRIYWEQYIAALRKSEAESGFLRKSNVFPLCGVGDVNTFAAFAELSVNICNPGGNVGVIVPFGIATQDGTKRYFETLIKSRRLRSLLQLENTDGIFPGVHPDTPFCLLTIGGDGACHQATFSFGAKSTIDALADDRLIQMGYEDFVLMRPNTKACPSFPSKRDMKLNKSIYSRSCVLVNEESGSNPWKVALGYACHMSHDSSEFKSGHHDNDADNELIRVYEGKCFWIYNHRYATFSEGEYVQPTLENLVNRHFTPRTKHYVRAEWMKSTMANLRVARGMDYSTKWFICFRDTTNSTNERTAIFSVVPESAPANNGPFMLIDKKHWRLTPCLIAVLSSFVFDYSARFAVNGLHLNFFLLKQLPVIAPGEFEKKCAWSTAESYATWIANRIAELLYTADDMSQFAIDCLGIRKPFLWQMQRRMRLSAEIDSAVFHLYGISREDVNYILESFPIVKRRDEHQYGEYRTKNLILEAYDAMADAIGTGRPFQTKLDPPPADPRCVHGYTQPADLVPLAAPTTLDDWARATVIAAAADKSRHSIKHLRLTQYLLGRPSLVAKVMSGVNLGLPPAASAPPASSSDLRQAITRSIDWAELTQVMQRKGNGTIDHDTGWDQARRSRPWLVTLWPSDSVALARQAAEAAERLLEDIRAGRTVSVDPDLVSELQAAAA